jgi:hypothetical protein
LGFYYQGCYALVALLRLTDDAAGVALETHDDVVLESLSLKTLAQIKNKQAPLSVRSDDFWNAVGRWAEYVSDPAVRFRFVVTSRIPDGSILRELKNDERHVSICEALCSEAKRVVELAEQEGDEAPFRRRAAGCRAFLGLTDAGRLELVRRLDIEDSSFEVGAYEPEVAALLTQTPVAIREKVAARLVEWWDRQVAMALMRKRQPLLRRGEVLETLAQTTQAYYSDRLPDDFADRQPPETLDETPVLVRQIRLIGGERFWINEAKQERWRARSQRNSWLDEQFAVVDRLDRFDKGLVREWLLRFEPRVGESPPASEAEERSKGQALFRWAFQDAWREVPPIQPEWKTPYLVRGSYQELANKRTVGWHPRYRELLDGGDDDA